MNLKEQLESCGRTVGSADASPLNLDDLFDLCYKIKKQRESEPPQALFSVRVQANISRKRLRHLVRQKRAAFLRKISTFTIFN